QFASDQNPDYITQNLDEKSLSALRVNLFLVTDSRGNSIFGKMVDPVTGRESPLPEQFNQLLPPGHPFLNHTPMSGTNTGILLLPQGPMIIVSSPVLSSKREGPPHGILVMGRSLNEYSFHRISRVTGNPISAHWSGEMMADDPQLSLLQKMNPAEAVSIPRSDNTIAGYTVISDINDQKILIVTDQPRDLYLNGLSIIRTYLFVFTFSLLGTLFIVLLVIDRTILKRLNHLTNRVRRIGNDNDMKPELTGRDEIALLEQAILSAHMDLKNSEQKLHTFIDAVSDPALLLKPDGTIILVNAALAHLFGEHPENFAGANFRTRLLAHDWEEEMKLVNEVIRDKKMVQQEMLFLGKNYLVSLYPVIGIDGNVAKIALLTVDISELKRVEGALQRATKKINLLNMVIFNDIQNQVFIQLGYFQLVKGLISDSRILGFIIKEETAAKEIQASLDFAKEYQDMGTKPPLWQNVNQVLMFALSPIDLSSITRIFHLDGLEIYADPLLEKVFFKIIRNTIVHATGATQIRAGFRENKEGLILFFEDDGPGITYGRKERIFDKDLGAGAATSLFVAREILSITGITLTENGEPGRGARFEIFVPVGSYRFKLL
ncbi:MAG: CHASE4 domain-containing protein, partial [Methanoregula sp.]|nr:CHASE4 domain-containing protein [Methanoregula sp.]